MKSFVEKYLTIHFDNWNQSTIDKILTKNQDALAKLNDQLFLSSYGYAKTTILQTPAIQNALEATAVDSGAKKKVLQPTICLSHDIDYLSTTTQMNIKRMVAQKNLKWSRKTYISSIEKLARVDASYGTSTFFICLPQKSNSPIRRLKQWILDPSYSVNSEEFKALKKILSKDNFEIGIHGSIYSISDKFLSQEVESIQAAFGIDRVVSSRQHWLNLPQDDSFQVIQQAGIKFDSTLGWNESWGFRGGFCDVFPIPATDIFEIPMLLMDGTMFDAMKMDENEVVKESLKALEIVKQHNGCVSINWHDRSASEDYGWLGAYEKILASAQKMGFQFKSISDAMASRGIQ